MVVDWLSTIGLVMVRQKWNGQLRHSADGFAMDWQVKNKNEKSIMSTPTTTEKKAENLMDGLFKEMNRCRELKAMYEEIPQGKFGARMIQIDIDNAEEAIKSNDVIKMLQAYNALKECQ
jgi:hypothetical protein